MNVWDFYVEAAKKVGKITDPNWYAFRLNSPRETVTEVTGSTRYVISKGKNKGKYAYKGEKTTVVVLDSELLAVQKAYSKKTGNCYNCAGAGRVTNGWSKETGTKYAKCKMCNGLGKSV